LSLARVFPRTPEPGTYLITFAMDGIADGLGRLDALGAADADVGAGVAHDLGAAVVRLAPSHLDELSVHSGSRHAIQTVERIGPFVASPIVRATPGTDVTARWHDTDAATWGMQAIAFDHGNASGVTIAVLDTGFGPCGAFTGRSVTAELFARNATDTTDGNGHGTMCTGIACGGLAPTGRRYGIATDADIYIAKVLTAAGWGRPQDVITGLNAAVRRRCQVISMSMSLASNDHLVGFDEIGRRALAAGSLIVACAGNEAPNTVVQPAASDGIMAVGAVDASGDMFPASSPSGRGPGAMVDLSAPGVAVFAPIADDQSGPRFSVGTGTSLAAPHVAGIAALHFAAGLSAEEVWNSS
jgi:subtilisin family serine protease